MAVLAVMAVLSVIAAAFAFEGRAESRIAAYALSQSQAFYTARAGVHAAAAAAREHARDPFHSLTAAWFSSRADYERVAFGEFFYSVVREAGPGYEFGLDDEESRLNVNVATPEMLMRLPGVTSVVAEAVAAFVADKKAAEDARRDRLGLARESEKDKDKPVTGPVRDLGELLSVPGVSRELLYGSGGGVAQARPGLASALTCYSSGKVNVNTAAPLTLAALGLGKRQIKAVLALRAEGFPGFRDLAEFNRVLAANTRDTSGSSFESADEDKNAGPAGAAPAPGKVLRPEAIQAARAPSSMDSPGAPGSSGASGSSGSSGLSGSLGSLDSPGSPDSLDAASAPPPANLLDVKSQNFRITALSFDSRGTPLTAVRARVSLGDDAMRFTRFAAAPAPAPAPAQSPSTQGGRS